MFDLIIIFIDAHEEPFKISKEVIDIAKKQRSRIIILSSMKESYSTKKTFEVLNLAKKQIAKNKLNCEVIQRAGDPHVVICDVAYECKADLIVIGARNLSLKSNSKDPESEIIQCAPCPVMVVP